jgi:oxygen-independent coproporphyrinogen-3 oxidase
VSPGIYVHIPFCRTKCNYCHFLSVPLEMKTAEKYVEALTREIEALPDCPCAREEVDTVYFGGGTPSLMPVAHIHRILQACCRRFVLSRDCEITMEGNPGTLSAQDASALHTIGVNRISIGAQSFDDFELASVGRLHNSETIHETLSELSRNCFENVSIDLMLGLPQQTRESWRKNLAKIDSLPVSHISVYMLDLDEECPLQKLAASGSVRLPSEDLVSDLYLETLEALDSRGFHQYEISNFARPGFSCRHNLKYWRRRPVLGFGLGSHSFDGRSRYANVSGMTEYLDAIATGKSPVSWQETPTREQALGETLFLGLRLSEGVDWRSLRREYSGDCLATFEDHLRGPADRGWIEWHDSTVRLTASGMLLSNEIFQLFL